MRVKYAALLLALLMPLAPSVRADMSASWTLAEMHQALEDAANSQDMLKQLLAKKVYEELQKQDVKFFGDNLVYQTPAQNFRTGLDAYNSDAVRKSILDYLNLSGLNIPNLDPAIGNCNTPLPGFSLLAIEGGMNGLTGTLFGDESAFLLTAAPGKVQLGFYATGELDSGANMNLVWGGTYPVPGTEYRCDIPVPPYPCGSVLHPKVCTTVCGYVPTVEWKCQEWKDGAGINAAAEVKASLIATFDSSYSIADKQIVLNKKLSLTGHIYSVNGAGDTLFSTPDWLTPYVTPDFLSITGPTPTSPYSAPIFAQLLGQVIGGVNTSLIGLSLVGETQAYVSQAYKDFLDKENAIFEERGYNQPIVIQLPNDVDDQLLKAVLTLLDKSGFTTFLVDFVRENLHEILYYLLTDDRASLEQLFTSAAACEAVKAFAIQMPVVPLYAVNDVGMCEVADVFGKDRGHYFTDPACTNEVAFRPTPDLEYCKLAMAGTPNALLGNATSWQPDPYQVNDVTPNIPTRKWTQWLGTRIPMSADPITANFSPYMKQVHYRDVTSAGHTKSCALEMRIYKKDITSQNRPALIALHGGSWTYRGAGYTALETTISHYTERGFVVFVPFYRLVGENDANPECNNATWQEVVSDAEAALDWVKYYGPLYGTAGSRVAVTGQSAGAHLSEWLVTHRPQDISAGLLHYAPADVYDFLANAHVGGTYEPWISSLSILSDFYGTDVSKVDLANPPDFVIQNSFARLVQSSPQPLPPVFMLHGIADPLVPSNQAVVLCNAYGGSAQNDGGGTALRAIYGCGSSGGELHLFEEGVHGLDACITDGLCLSGSQESANLVADSSRKGRDWLYDRTAVPIVLPAASVVASKGTASAVMDGNLGSAWVAQSGAFLQFDLSIPRPLGAIGAVWGGGLSNSAPSFAVQVSLDGANWSQIFQGQASGVTNQIQVFDFVNTDARYVRFVALGGDRATPLRVAELRLYGPTTPSPIATRLVQTSFGGVQGLLKAVTGDNQWNQYDLGGLFDIAHVMFSVPENEKVELQFSRDGQTWTPMAFSQGPGNDRLLDFREVTASAIRLKAPRNASVSGDVSFTVYGAKVDTLAAGITSSGSEGGGGGGGGSTEWMLLLLLTLTLLGRRRR